VAWSTSGVCADYWIGGSDAATEGWWQWSDGADFAPFTAWGSGEPNNSGGVEHYAVLGQNGSWNDVPSILLPYVCERVLPPPCSDCAAKLPVAQYKPCEGVLWGGRCYKAFAGSTTQDQAEAACKGWAGDAQLASIASVEENQAVLEASRATCPAAAGAWIGASDAAKEGTWVWFDGTPFTYEHWDSGQPDNGAGGAAQNHAEIRPTGLWNDKENTFVGSCRVCERAAPPSCDADGNPCTVDACTATGSCASIPKDCADGYNCTIDTCSAKQGGCAHSTLHDRCTAGDPIDAGCTAWGGCVASICKQFPSCCSASWNATCIDAVLSVCKVLACPGTSGKCGHSLCATGSMLAVGCDSPPNSPSCATAVCGQKSSCCSYLGGSWKQECIDLLGSACGKTCP